MTNIEWKEFIIGEIFELKNSYSYHKSDVVESDKNDSLLYITRTSMNNGVEMYVEKDIHFNINSGNQIVFGAENANFFYQETPFITGNKMYTLDHEKMNKSIGLFLVGALRNAIKGSGFGYSLGMTATRLSTRKILLPSNNKKCPDWAYIAEIGSSLYSYQTHKLQAYLNNKYKKAIHVDVLTLEDKQWKAFSVEQIFPKIQRGKRLKKFDHITGTIPYISSTSLNNGIDNFIGNINNVRVSNFDITIANSGSVGYSFYHPYEYISSDHVHSLTNTSFNKYHYLFLLTLLNRLQEKYHFNREINDKRLKRDKLILPVNEDGDLDLDFMEAYMQNIEKNQIEKILDNFSKHK